MAEIVLAAFAAHDAVVEPVKEIAAVAGGSLKVGALFPAPHFQTFGSLQAQASCPNRYRYLLPHSLLLSSGHPHWQGRSLKWDVLERSLARAAASEAPVSEAVPEQLLFVVPVRSAANYAAASAAHVVAAVLRVVQSNRSADSLDPVSEARAVAEASIGV